MKNIILFLLFCISPLIGEQRATPDLVYTPTVFINQSVDVITGINHELLVGCSTKKLITEYYEAGCNKVGDVVLDIEKNDPRIGKVRLQRLFDSGEILFQFFYYPGYTEVLNQSGLKTTYHYSKQNYITSITQGSETFLEAQSLKRKENLYWDEATPPRLISRTFENEKSDVLFGKNFDYDDRGNLIKETLFGNLSGDGLDDIEISPEGLLIADFGTEHYSISYEYSVDEKPLLLKKIEENGLITQYSYHNKTHKCLSEIVKDAKQIYKRTFYFYDKNEFLCKTVKDDGCAENVEDLDGIVHREIVIITPFEINSGIFLPCKIEKRFLDVETGKEIVIEKREKTYSIDGKVIKEELFEGFGVSQQIINRQYDAEGRLVDIHTSEGGTNTTTYHWNGYSTSSYDPFTKETTISQYDIRGLLIHRVVQASDREPKTTSFRYKNGQKIASIDHFGNETTYEYDQLERLTAINYPKVQSKKNGVAVDPIERFNYDIANNLTSSFDANAYQTITDYNSRQQPCLIKYPDGTFEMFAYHLDGTLASKQEKNRQIVSYKRDGLGRVLVEERCYNGKILDQTSYTYRGSLLESTKTLEGYFTSYTYDYAGRKIEILQVLGDMSKRTTYAYDSKGQLLKTQEWFGDNAADSLITIQEKDADDKVFAVRVEDGQGHLLKRVVSPSEKSVNPVVERSILNENDQYVLQQEMTDQKGLKTILTFDSRSLPVHVVIKNRMGAIVSEKDCSYDRNGNKMDKMHTVYADGKQVGKYQQSWKYGPLNRIECMVEGVGSENPKKTVYAYDFIGQLTSMTKPDGVVLHYQYNDKGLLSSMCASDGSVSYDYHYNEHGKITLVEDKLLKKKTERTYNVLNQITHETLANGLAFSSSYDKRGRKTKMTLPDNSSVIFMYDTGFLREVKRLSSDNQMLYAHLYRNYDEKGSLTEAQLIGSLGTMQFVYDESRRLINIKSPYWSEIIPEGGYDSEGCLLKKVVSDFEKSIESLYAYSDEQQLIEEQSCNPTSYAYDSIYNRLRKDSKSYKIDGNNQLINDGEISYRYDNNGNMVEKKAPNQTTLFQYDALNRLISVQKPKKFIVKYTYDAFNRRLTKSRDEWDEKQSQWLRKGFYSFLFDSDKEIGVADEQGSILELRVLGLGIGAEIGAAVAIERQGNIYAPIHDHQGSVCCLIDMKEKKAVEYYRYSAFGEEEIFNAQGKILADSEMKNPWRFSSKRLDRETGFIYFGNRFYNPLTGRWTTPDPIGSTETPNLYAYLKNNPLTHVDMHGLFSMSNVFNGFIWTGHYIADALGKASSSFGSCIMDELDLSDTVRKSLDEGAREFLGDVSLLLLGYGLDESFVDVTGKGEVSDKVRVTLINGILNRYQVHMENANEMSLLLGGVNIHFAFHATGGWSWDMINCLLAKAGFVTSHARRLAEKWKTLIQEMGGTEGGGKIIHFAHSLGGVDTACARTLLTPEELKMIYVYTFGSPVMVDNKGFGGAENYVAWRDGVTWFASYGYLKSWITGEGSFTMVGSAYGIPSIDHQFLGHAYHPILHHLGTQFQQEYGTVN